MHGVQNLSKNHISQVTHLCALLCDFPRVKRPSLVNLRFTESCRVPTFDFQIESRLGFQRPQKWPRALGLWESQHHVTPWSGVNIQCSVHSRGGDHDLHPNNNLTMQAYRSPIPRL